MVRSTPREVFLLQEEQTLTLSAEALDPSAAQAIYEKYKGKIEIEFPNLVNGQRYSLRAPGYVGQVPVTESLSLCIVPKVPVKNLFGMLEFAYNLKSFEILRGTAEFDALEDLMGSLATILSKMVLERARRGLYRGYRRHSGPMHTVRGRIFLAQSIRASVSGIPRIHCRYDEHTANLEDNQILAWTLHQVSRMTFQREEPQRLAKQAYRTLLGEVDVREFDLADLLNRFYHRLNQDYRPMHALCRFFIENLAQGPDVGLHEGLPFLVHMPNLFQTFVAEYLRLHPIPGLDVTRQYGVQLDPEGRFRFVVDIVLRSTLSGRTVAVLDTKYKSGAPLESDLQQIIAYAVKLEAPEAILVYPQTVTQPVDFSVSGIHVRGLAFDLSKNILESGHEFVHSLTSLLAPRND